jgi:hypothetical protein
MLISISQELTVNETFTLARFGEVTLASDGRVFTPTNIVSPGAAAIAQQDLNDRRSIVLDDGNNQQNIDPTIHPTGGLSASNTLRSGYTVTGLEGIADQRFSVYRIQPTGPVTFSPDNARTAAPGSVGGNVKVASFNVLNFFNGDGLGGGFPTPRGANTLAEFQRQLAKEVAALSAMNADVVGLMEMENDSGANQAIADLVNALNNAMGAGTYAYIDTGHVGTDEIRVAMIYKPASVTPLGAFAILDSSVNPLFIDTKNRPVLAQSFTLNGNGEVFTVVVNHLKSKGSDCNDVGDPDTGDGQGNCNLTRLHAVQAETAWLSSDPTGAGDPDYLVIGDMNSYAKENPISQFESDGYINLVNTYIGADAYSYIFDAASGYLDHALASGSMAGQASGVAEWHINADEPIALDYNTEFKSANQINTFYASDAYRASDHDPVLVGLTLAGACALGTYSATGANSAGPCTPADAGHYVDTVGATSQTACAAGYYQPSTGQTSCLAADAGHYVDTTGAASQTECAAGYYQPNTAQTACIAADPGHFASGTGSTAQVACGIGTYQPNSGQGSCINADPGHYVSTSAAIAQTACALGYYQPLSAQATCYAASIGYYVDTTGSATQTACPPGYTTATTASDSISDCYAPLAALSLTGEIKSDQFKVNGTFTLGAGNNGINLATETFTLQVGSYTISVAPGSFTPTGKYEAIVGGVAVKLQLTYMGGSTWQLKAEAKGCGKVANSNPVTITLTVGDDTGTTNATLKF